jgi:predicted secreted Zn-dependent protease
VCTAADVRVFVELTVHVPRWRAPPDAPAASVGNWQRYVRALSEHEQGHVDRILAIVARMPEVLAEQGCDGVDVRGREALDVIREANAAYDEATGSGALQGAVLFLPRG